MTIQAELAMSIDHNTLTSSLHHQHHHHHHYHVHHLLHHPHLHNQTVQNHYHRINDHAHNYQTSIVQSRKISHVVSPAQRDAQHHAPTIKDNREAIRATQKSQIQLFLVAAIAYILSPIDLVPEVIFGVFGIFDDVLFLLMCLFCIAIILVYPIFREVRRTIFDKLGLKGLLI